VRPGSGGKQRRGSSPRCRCHDGGPRIHPAPPTVAGRLGFERYDEYARWIIDQHLSIAVWPTEHVVQDMHRDFAGSTITPLRCTTCRVSDLDGLVEDPTQPIDCFVAEGLRVLLDDISLMARDVSDMPSACSCRLPSPGGA
jgi:hypothetical protein